MKEDQESAGYSHIRTFEVRISDDEGQSGSGAGVSDPILNIKCSVTRMDRTPLSPLEVRTTS